MSKTFTLDQIRAALIKVDGQWAAKRGAKGPSPSMAEYLAAIQLSEAVIEEVTDKHDRSGAVTSER